MAQDRWQSVTNLLRVSPVQRISTARSIPFIPSIPLHPAHPAASSRRFIPPIPLFHPAHPAVSSRGSIRPMPPL